jgi:hypothetical protein
MGHPAVPTARARISALGIACALGAHAVALGGAATDARARGADALAAQATRAELDAFLGQPPALCVASDAGLELCEWRLSSRDPAWTSLAASIGTDSRVNVLCEIPGGGAARAPGSCSVHPRRSARRGWEIPNLVVRKGSNQSRADRRAARERLVRRAEAMLAEAETLVELSRLVGAAPDQCRGLESGTRSCLWRATSRTEGHGMLAASILAPQRKKVRLECRLPAGGAPRGAGSCKVEIGA